MANPTGYWHHQGSYTILLTRFSPTEHLPTSVKVELQRDSQLVTVNNGRIKQVMGGIEFFDENDRQFHWGYKFIKEIRDEEGQLIWQNRDYADQ